MPSLANKKILIIATHRFEQEELFGPKAYCEAEGAIVTLASPDLEPIMGTVLDEPGKFIAPDLLIAAVNVADFDALILPGGIVNPDMLRLDQQAMAIIRHFVAADKPVAAICHAPWLLVEAGVVEGREVTSWPSIRTDLVNAGGRWVDAAAVVDGPILTSRSPDDIRAFCLALTTMIQHRAN